MKTNLIQKDQKYPSLATLYLPMMWEILTAQIREEINNSLVYRWLFLGELEGCHRSAQPPGEQSKAEKCSLGVDLQQKGLLYSPTNLNNRQSPLVV